MNVLDCFITKLCPYNTCRSLPPPPSLREEIVHKCQQLLLEIIKVHSIALRIFLNVMLRYHILIHVIYQHVTALRIGEKCNQSIVLPNEKTSNLQGSIV